MSLSELEQALSVSPPTRETLSQAVKTFTRIASLSDTSFANTTEEAVLNAEFAARTQGLHLISEQQLADAFTKMMRLVGAPQWAGSSPQDIHDFRSAVKSIMPHLVGDEAGGIREKLTPLEALYIFHVLSLNGGLVRDPSYGTTYRAEGRSATKPVVHSQSAAVTDPRRIEFITFRTRFLDSASPMQLEELGRSLLELLTIPN